MWMGAVLCALLCVLSACSGSDSSPPAASPPSSSPPPTNPPPGGVAGPWPVADLTLYASTHGLSGTIIDAGSDEAQNIWAATPDTLYVLQPGQTTFTPFTAANGLHIQSITDTTGTTVSNITALAGGHGNEVFVGYRGYEATIPPPGASIVLSSPMPISAIPAGIWVRPTKSRSIWMERSPSSAMNFSAMPRPTAGRSGQHGA